MPTINLQGISGEDTFREILSTLQKDFSVFESGIAPQASGSKTAEWAKVITNVVSIARSTATQYLDVLKHNSNDLLELSQAFESLTRDGTIELRSFYETEKTRVMVGKIVDDRSALIGSSAEKRFPVAADHRSICKFDHESNHAFVQIVQQMVDICKNLGINLSY
ncbi:hypothetical protein SLS54_009618 [Diplodia seriata]